MGFGHTADVIAGQLSKALHGLRGPRESTIGDLSPYLDLPAASLFPEPPALKNVEMRANVADALLHTLTLSWNSTHEVFCPRYRVRHEGEFRSNLTAWARWVRPDQKRRSRCLVYVHGWLEPGSWIEEALIFPRWTRRLGVDVVHVCLPFHGRRNPRGALFSGEHFWTADLVRSFEAVRQTIHDTRSIMGFLREQGYEEVGAAGISVGGSLAMLLACLEPTPDYVVPIVCHVDMAEAVEHASILWRVKRDLERWGVDREHRRQIFDRLGLARFRPILPPERQLWIEAEEDAHIDPRVVERQWKEWGQPKIHWIRGGHMTFPLHLREFTDVMADFLRGLGPPPAGRGRAAA